MQHLFGFCFVLFCSAFDCFWATPSYAQGSELKESLLVGLQGPYGVVGIKLDWLCARSAHQPLFYLSIPLPALY